ncbi:hypothetical protein KVR01_005669 [Diaporthe batatas]|uniref:uncharacterized protein n=1 Tax=Diaporthe batatas TaxID=748121 RepID=UPI001D0392CA|nr:uncharacterized protein KVR01_005669 [Diaporthe batatas]KAG8165394.1 hypothetical protein KVR01_005669 [Diaporthe batatas]
MKHRQRNKDVRHVIGARMACLRLQLTQSLTPLLRKETRLLLEMHSVALEEQDLASEVNILKNLDRLHKQLVQHWCKVYKNPLCHSFLLADMIQCQTHLAEMLLHDYVGESYSPTEWASNRAETIRQKKAAERYTSSDDLTQAHDSDSDSSDAHDSGGSEVHESKSSDAHDSDGPEAHDADSSEPDADNEDLKGDYHDGIVFPLNELALNVAHAEERLFSAEAEQLRMRSGAGYVTELIRRTDWKKLAETLLNDRELAGDLFSEEPMLNDCFDNKTSKKVLDGINKVERKYFVELSSPSKYTISKHAMDLSARYSPNSPNCASLPLSGTEKPTDVSRKDRARGVLGAIAGGIKGLGTAGPQGNSRASSGPTSTNDSKLDERALLMNLEDI